MQLWSAQVLYDDLAAGPWSSLAVMALSLSPEMVTAGLRPATSTPSFHIWESRNACLNPTACQQHNPYSDAIKESAQFLFVQSKDCGVWGSQRRRTIFLFSTLTGFLYFVLGLSLGQVLGVSLVVILWADPRQWESGPTLSHILTIVLWVGSTLFFKNPFCRCGDWSRK